MRREKRLQIADDAWGVGNHVLREHDAGNCVRAHPVHDRLEQHHPVHAQQAADTDEAEAEAELDPGAELGGNDDQQREAGRPVRVLRGDQADRGQRQEVGEDQLQRARVLPALGVDVEVAAAGDDAGVDGQADTVGRPVLRNNDTDISALGAAQLAGLALGVWRSVDELAALPKSLDRFEPRISDAQRRTALSAWEDAVARCLFDPSRIPEAAIGGV